jgi:channel protein (hemolysin III family)
MMTGAVALGGGTKPTTPEERNSVSTPGIFPIGGFSEPVSSMTHLAGAGVFAFLTIPLLRRGWGDRIRVACLAVYAGSCVLLMAISGVYHLLAPGGAGRDVMLRLDHAAIFVLIAGTFTAVHGILFHGRWRWEPIILFWAVTAAAVTLKTVFFNQVPEWVGLSLYLCLGWVGLVTGGVLWARYGWGFIRPLAWGGVAYTFGAVMEYIGWMVVIRGVVGPHELFHLAVLAGAGFHWRFVYSFASGAPPLPGSGDSGLGAQTSGEEWLSSPGFMPVRGDGRAAPMGNVPGPSR